MIGVSAADLDLLKAASAGAPARKPFRIPRPGSADDEAGAPGEQSAEAASAGVFAPAPLQASGFAGAAPSNGLFALRSPDAEQGEDDLEASLPAVVAPASPRNLSNVAAPAARSHATLDPEAEAVPESLAEPSTPLSLSELPPPVAGSGRPPAPASREEAAQPSPLELDFGDELPVVAASPARKPPPPRRARPQQPELRNQSAEAEDALDLPARIEDLEVGLPKVAAPPPRASSPRERPPQRNKPSSLDELDLPSMPERKPMLEPSLPFEVGGLDLPSAARPPIAPPQRNDADYPAVRARAEKQPPPASRPISELPDVLGAALPDLAPTGLPSVARAELPSVLDEGLPDILRAGLPSVSGAGLPAVVSAGLPSPASAGLPDVIASGLPEVAGAGLPEVLAAGLPVVGGPGLPAVLRAELPVASPTGLPEVAGRGVAGFGRVDLPVAREAGLPQVRGVGEIDLPGVGESLPSLVGDDDFGEANLPIVGDALPASKAGAGRSRRAGDGLPDGFDTGDPFGDAAGDDPFAAPDADLNLGAVDDPFAADQRANWVEGIAGPGAKSSAPPSSGYGEVDIGGGADAPLETDDMEFRAIPERKSSPPGRAAASAAVHEAGDVEANGSTLELGQERRTTTRNRTRRLSAAAAFCLALVAGGALALKPEYGPFGVHFILDQVKRAEHERVLAGLVEQGRKNRALDSFEAVRDSLARLDAARQEAPRFQPLQARFAFENFDAVLRFGPLPKLEAAAKAAMAQVDSDSNAEGHRLARAAEAAVLKRPEARAQIEGLGANVDARLVLGELTLATRDYAAASALWKELVASQPDSARAAFGLGRAELGGGKPESAKAAAERALQLNPGHVGAQILMLEARRAAARSNAKDRPENIDSEALMAAVGRVLPQASPGEAAWAHSVLGEVHMAQGRTGPARQAFEEALAIDRNFPRALMGLGETLHLAGRHTEALARFEAAAKEQPGALAAEIGIAKSQLHLAKLPEAKATLTKLHEKNKTNAEVIYWLAKAEQAIGNNDAALLGYRASIEAGNGRADSVGAYLALAKLQADLGQLAQAQKTLSEADDKLPPNSELHNALGEIALNRAQYADAYAQFQKAERLDPGDTRARFFGAVALTRLGRFDEALAAFERVSETDKEFPGLAMERGRLFEESGRIQEALKEYEAAFAKAPEDLELQVRVGCARLGAGKASEAETLLENITKSLPRSAEAAHCLGRALLEQGRYAEAIARLERAVQLDATRPVYHLYVGWALAEGGRHGDAQYALERALELDKGLADALWQRGRLRLKQGAVKDAIKDLERALELKPARTEARADLAVAYADLGRLPQALRAWEDALARDPDNGTWHFRYGKLLSSSGHSAEAAAHLKRAIDLAQPDSAVPGTATPKPPAWLWQAHYLLARELGLIPAAIVHWQAYMRLSAPDDPYRPEAIRALETLGQPWER